MKKIFHFMCQRLVLCSFLTITSATNLVLGQEPMEVIRFDVSLVTVNVAVKDSKGRPLLGLKSDDFFITDENDRVSPEYFESEGPASIVFVVDSSSSMKGAKWKSLLAGLKSFLKKSRVDNDYTLITFQSEASVVAEAVNAEEFRKSLSALTPSGETAMYDGVMLGLQALGRARQRNRALVLISDGEDNASRTKLPELEHEASFRRATIYSVGVLLKDYCARGITEACSGQETLKQLVATTAGVVFFPDDLDLARTLKQISGEVNSQYSLSYYPPTRSAGWRTVHVAIAQNQRHPRLRYQERYLMK